jgi:hypothetical protein
LPDTQERKEPEYPLDVQPYGVSVAALDDWAVPEHVDER